MRSAGTTQDQILGKRIRFRRIELGMSREELGAKLEVSPMTVEQFEDGVLRIGASRLPDLCYLLNVRLVDLFTPVSD